MAGKSSLVHALLREICVRKGRDQYGFGKGIDPYGLITKANISTRCAGFGWTDTDLVTLMGSTPLSTEQSKAFLDPGETASFPARYHMAIFPKTYNNSPKRITNVNKYKKRKTM